MSIQDLKRAPVSPAIGIQPTDPQQIAMVFWLRFLAQELNAVHNAIEAFSVAVAGGSGTATVTLPVPYPDNLYTALATPSWATICYIAAAGDRTASTVKFTFSVAAPGGGGTLYVVTIR